MECSVIVPSRHNNEKLCKQNFHNVVGPVIFSGDAGDQEFEPSADMLVHDYDDEQTLAEEDALAIAGGEDPQNELNSLQKVILLLL